MKRIRSKGYAVNQEEHIAGAVGLAVPIRNSSARVVAGLSLHAPLVRMSVDAAQAFLPQVIDGARRIEQQIAWMTDNELAN